MKTFSAPEQKYEVANSAGRVLPLARVFVYFALGLAIVGGVAMGWPYLLSSFLTTTDSFLNGMTVSYIVAIFGVLGFSLALQIKAMRKKSIWMWVFYIGYALSLGIFLSSIILAYAPESFMGTGEGGEGREGMVTIGLAFAISGGCMLVMGFLGMIFKNMWKMMPLVGTLLLGVLIISLVNVFFFNKTVYWIVDFVFFGVILLMTAIDINRLIRLADGGFLGTDNNWAIYMASTLLTDFVWIFIRVLRYVGISRR